MTIDQNKMRVQTLAAQALGKENPATGAVVPDISVSTTFARNPDYSLPDERSYLRDHGPTQEQVEDLLVALEGGSDGLSFSSGLAACTAPFHALQQGDHVVVADTLYHGVTNWLEHFAESRGLTWSTFSAGNTDDFVARVRPGQTRMAWIETPANPTWVVTDIAAVAEVARKHHILLAVDSTCATPVLTQPLSLGADIVCHSATKYLNGHSDLLAGMLVTSTDSAIWQRIRQHRLLAGCTLGSLDAFMLQRGMRTLYIRVRQQCENAMSIARFLETLPGIDKVMYPGLESASDHAVAARQMRGGFGGMLSVQVKGGKAEALSALSRASVFKRATSLGGVESLIEHRKTIEPETSPIPDNLIRISVGIEHIDDLRDDLREMFS